METIKVSGNDYVAPHPDCKPFHASVRRIVASLMENNPQLPYQLVVQKNNLSLSGNYFPDAAEKLLWRIEVNPSPDENEADIVHFNFAVRPAGKNKTPLLEIQADFFAIEEGLSLIRAFSPEQESYGADELELLEQISSEVKRQITVQAKEK